MYQTSLLSGATYAGGGWLPCLSACSVDTLDRAQNRNLRIITRQLALTPTKALKESGHSAHSVLPPLQACLRGLKGCVCFQWVPTHWGLLGNERADEEARKAAYLSPADGAQRGRISFEVVKGLIWSQVKDKPPNHAHTLQVYSDGPFRHLQGVSRRKEVLLA
jgi:hypothetical protein